MTSREAIALAADIARVMRVWGAVERDRVGLGTADAVARARGRGREVAVRGTRDRASLRRAIAIVDRRMGPPNCFRRALLEMSLDRTSASETLHVEINDSSLPESGHARLDSWPSDGRSFDATIRL